MLFNFLRRCFTVALAAVALMSLLLSGCASKQVDQEQYSGYLGEDAYAALQEIEYPSGAVGMAFIDPYIYSGDFYDRYLSPVQVMVDPVVWYPAPEPGAQVLSDVLMQLAAYYNEKIVDEIKQRNIAVVDRPGPGVVRVSPAFTGVETAAEGMKVYEVLPVAAVFGAAKAATGKRDRVVEVFSEIKIVDSQTGKRFVSAVRKGVGSEKLKGKEEQLTLEHSRPVLDQFVNDFIDSLQLLQQGVVVGQ